MNSLRASTILHLSLLRAIHLSANDKSTSSKFYYSRDLVSGEDIAFFLEKERKKRAASEKQAYGWYEKGRIEREKPDNVLLTHEKFKVRKNAKSRKVDRLLR